jgi:hypothetical protein
MERWLPITGRPRYEISSEGRVRSHNGMLNLHTNVKTGYVQVWVGWPRVLAYVHTLVLEAFIGPRPAGLLGLHQNDVKPDNSLENLRWGTRTENAADAKRNTAAVVNGSGYLMADSVRHFARAGFNNSEIGELLDINRRTASAVLNGKAWT